MKFKIGVRTKEIYKMGLSSKIGIFGRSNGIPLERIGIFKQIWDFKLQLIIFWAFPLTIDGDYGLASQSPHGLAAGLCGGRGLDRRLPHQGLEVHHWLQVEQAWGLEWMGNACIGGD
jgi:hypothetical protein